jgi:hypothetical protein
MVVVSAERMVALDSLLVVLLVDNWAEQMVLMLADELAQL